MNTLKLSEPYLRRKIRGRRVSVHRQVAEEMLGRPLLPNEVVHHKNENTRDNRPENLEVLPAGEHTRLHSTGRKASTDTRRKMSQSKIGNTNSLGYKHTEETLKLRSARRTGVPVSDSARENLTKARRQRMKVYVLRSPDGERIEVRALHQFCKENGLSVSGIANVVNGSGKHHKGWTVLEVRNAS